MGETFLERPARAGGTGGCSGNGGFGTLLVPPVAGVGWRSPRLGSHPRVGLTLIPRVVVTPWVVPGLSPRWFGRGIGEKWICPVRGSFHGDL